jgi:predicted  nucleic acid-binding Zn-ribbon protein
MKRTVSPLSGNHRAVSRPMLFVLLLLFAVTVMTVDAARSSRQRPLSLDEINNRLTSLQGKADSLTQVISRLKQDSSRLKQESMQLSSSLSKRQSEIDEIIARKKGAVNGFRLQYEKARQDSIGILTASREQMAGLHKEIVRLESSIITMSNELEVLSARRDQMDRPSAGAEGKAVERLQAQIVRSDSAIKARQAAFGDLSGRRDKLRKDSVQEDSRLSASRREFHDQIVAIDNDIAKVNSALAAAKQKNTTIKSEREKKIAEIRANITSLSAKKRGYADQIRRAETEVTALASEKQRLTQSAGAAQKRYAQLRAPQARALEDAEAVLKRALTEKEQIKALREKLRLDSTISKSRDALDAAMQAEVTKKKGAKKLVEQRETELNTLLNTLDGLVQNTPGLRQIEAQFHAPTLAQKTGKVADALILADKPIAKATMDRDRAKQALAGFDKSNPPPPDPSNLRISGIDSASTAKKKMIIQMTEQIDSITMVTAEQQTVLESLTKSLAGETSKGDSLTIAKKAEKASLAAKKTKLVRDSIQNETANTAAINRIKTELSGVNSKLILAQNDITAFTAEREKAKVSLKTAQERTNQAQTSLKTERQKTDSLIAAKQQEITFSSMKCEKLRQDSITLAKRETQQIKSLNPPPATFGAQVAVAEKELAGLQAKSDSIRRETGSVQARPAEEGRKLSIQMAAIVRSINATQGEIATMKKAKDALYERLKNDQGRYDSLLSTMEQNLAAAITKRDKARQDSADAEATLRQASQILQADIMEQENSAGARQREINEATAAWSQAREDSAKILGKVSGTLQNLSQAIRSIDVLISAKEKEIADLKARRDKTKQDSVAEHKRLNESLAAAHNEIVKRGAVVTKKKTEAALAASDRKKTPADTAAYKQKAKLELAAAVGEIERQNALIERKKNDLARLQKERDEINAPARTSSRSEGIIVTDTKPAPSTPTFSPSNAPSAAVSQPAAEVQAPTPVEIAQLRSEELYTMLGENKVNEAAKRFRQLQGFLKSNLDDEAFQTLKMTIEQMGGSVR